MIAGYFKLVDLADEVRAAHKVRSKARRDCTVFWSQQHQGHFGLTNFVNTKGQLAFYLTPCKDIVSTDSQRLAEWSLTNNSLNLTSIYIEDLDCPDIGYGYPNANRFLSNRTANPMFPYRNDGYLFLINREYSEIEILIIKDGRNLISSYYQKAIDGGFDEQIKRIRAEARPWFKYDGIV